MAAAPHDAKEGKPEKEKKAKKEHKLHDAGKPDKEKIAKEHGKYDEGLVPVVMFFVHELQTRAKVVKKLAEMFTGWTAYKEADINHFSHWYASKLVAQFTGKKPRAGEYMKDKLLVVWRMRPRDKYTWLSEKMSAMWKESS